jgi:hypothetical protein
LNPADGNYLNEFRINEAVDISYTKYRDAMIDNSPHNFVPQDSDKLYVGWTAPGEMGEVYRDVVEAGKYKLGLMYTANQNGKISISVNDVDVSGRSIYLQLMLRPIQFPGVNGIIGIILNELLKLN